ncbi:CpaF family protein [Gemmata sp. JC717]|uniref:CpaF family protein n=1 Tax=Gemmata algarum TaxID=2975278 RepID=UPI0021BAADA6|nr:CpaF family protein [Gemmata algarum]MDY3554908.1 CpaF family protein [Gemmata algarum]
MNRFLPRSPQPALERARAEAPASPADSDDLRRFKAQLHRRLVVGMDLSALNALTREQLRQEVRRVAEELCQRSPNLLNQQERERLVGEVLDETFGLGPLEALMRDPTVSDILINGPHTVYAERHGRLELTDVKFTDAAHLLHIVQRIVTQSGRRVDETCPMVDSRLPDGSRINAIIPPLALDGALVSIRRFAARPIRAADLVSNRSAPQEVMDFLAACVRARLNVVVSGGTGSGKTTLLNALSVFIPDDERVITIEDAAELRLQQPHVGRMETRPNNIEGVGAVGTRDLVRNALRMRPDRIVIGECRGPEALDMLQAMNTGHDGSLTTVHANDTREALGRLEVMVGMAGLDLPMWVIRRQIAAAVHVVVQVSRLTGGARKVVKVSEVTGTEGDNFAMQDLFVFQQNGVDAERRAQGGFHATGLRPHWQGRLEAHGQALPTDLFRKRILQPAPAGADRSTWK